MAERLPPKPPVRVNEPEPSKPPILDDKEALEIVRQVEKRNEFIVKLRQVLEASVRAQSDLAARQRAVEVETGKIDEIKRSQEAANEQVKAEAGRLKAELQKDYEQTKGRYVGEVERFKQQLATLQTQIRNSETEIEELEKEKRKQRNSFEVFKAQAQEAREVLENEAVTRKRDLETELEALKQKIRNLSSRVDSLLAS